MTRGRIFIAAAALLIAVAGAGVGFMARQVTPTEAETMAVTPVVGPQGPAGTNGTNGTNGAAATIAVGTVSTLTPGSSATVVNAGTSAAAVFNFGIPAGQTGAAGPASVGNPSSLTRSLATAYQCTNTAKPCIVSINITSTANFSLLGGTTNSADVLIGATNGVAGGTGTIIGQYSNSVTGTIAVGLNMNSVYAGQYVLMVPVGWYYAIRQTNGTVSIASAFEQVLG